MITFAATRVAVLEEDDVLIVALGDERDSLMFQHPLAGHDEQDRRLGMAQPYIEYRGQAYGWYGHMARVELHRDSLLVHMDASAAQRLGSDGRFDVRFAIDDDAFDRLRVGLDTTFGGCAYFSVHA